MPYEFTMQRSVEFSETDMAGIMHFSNYFRYMESTEHAFFRSLGLALHREQDGAMTGFARVRAECDFIAPLRYQDEVSIRLLVREKTSKSFTYDFTFTREGDGGQGRPVARGQLQVVCVRKAPGDSRMRAADMPAEFFAVVEVAPAGLLEARKADHA